MIRYKNPTEQWLKNVNSLHEQIDRTSKLFSNSFLDSLERQKRLVERLKVQNPFSEIDRLVQRISQLTCINIHTNSSVLRSYVVENDLEPEEPDWNVFPPPKNHYWW